MNDLLFKEEQQFSRWWILLFLTGLPIVAIASYSTGDYRPVWFTLPFFAIVTFLFVMIRLRTRITKREVEFQFYPFVKRKYAWRDIEKAEVLDYGFVGGWGIRIGTKYGTVYNVAGKKGLQLILKNGKKIVIGTQKSAELGRWLEQMRNTDAEHR